MPSKSEAKQRERIKAVENKFRKTGEALFDNLNPFQRNISSLEKSIRLIVISFTLLFFYQLISQFKTTIYYIKDLPGFPFESGFYLLPQILLPIAIFLFWKRKSIGWILLVAFVTYTTVLAVAMAIQSFFLGTLRLRGSRQFVPNAVYNIISFFTGSLGWNTIYAM